MTKKKRSSSNNELMQFIVPAFIGAAVSAAAFALFLSMGVDRTGSPSPAQAPASKPAGDMTAFNDSQRAAIERTIKDYLLGNPQILIQMSEALDKYQAEARDKQTISAIEENADSIFRDGYGLETGNPKGDVTIVEFSDYNCPYCKRAFTDIVKLLDADKNVRVVFKEFPIFGERSIAVARVAIAASKQNKYFEMHAALMKKRGQSTEQSALLLAEKMGLDMDKLRKDMKSDEVSKIITSTREIGNKLGIQGTPFYLIGDRSIPGAPEDLFKAFQQKVADVRLNGCETSC